MFLGSIVFLLGMVACGKEPLRQVISLNGEWEIAKTAGEVATQYRSTVPVPGLVDLAQPALDEPGCLFLEGWYWHRRHFTLDRNDYDKVELKIFKAKYHTKVYINGQFAGENLYCFTPAYFDLKPYLKPAGEQNEIVIGVGNRPSLPDSIPNGRDGEKNRYIPGIYDNVELTLSNKPYIVNIQCVPDIVNEQLRVVAELETDDPAALELTYAVREAASGKQVAERTIRPEAVVEGAVAKVDFTIDLPGARLWSPDDPFLYELYLNTGADDCSVRFGMRSFRADVERQVILLNEKPYYMKGTNVCIFRFFEDPERGELPWDHQWTRTLHERFKEMHWDAIRYCIGFPPEHWYEVCDSLGILLQDEYPIWWFRNPDLQPGMTSEHLAEEYRRWMRERWNHPSVVIWDAQNESLTTRTNAAVDMVRDLDLSDRPWENGWGMPRRESDLIESHPYLFMSYHQRRAKKEPAIGYKKELFGTVREADNNVAVKIDSLRENGIRLPNLNIINEYGWIWLNRDGSPTTLTDRVYEKLWNSPALTADERFEIYARNLAMLTEYWRAHRKVAGILHFCGLGYSRPEPPRGQTSDHWVDLQNLVFEPRMHKYLKPAFAPVGLMVDLWEKEYQAGTTIEVPVYVINDLGETANQEVVLTLARDSVKVGEPQVRKVSVEPYQVRVERFELALPTDPGEYTLTASMQHDGEEVFSVRDIPVRK